MLLGGVVGSEVPAAKTGKTAPNALVVQVEGPTCIPSRTRSDQEKSLNSVAS